MHVKCYSNNAIILLIWYHSLDPLLISVVSLVLLTDAYTAKSKMAYIPDSHYVVTMWYLLCLVSRMEMQIPYD